MINARADDAGACSSTHQAASKADQARVAAMTAARESAQQG